MRALPRSGSRTRLSQPERAAATRDALIEATLECLLEVGYQGATTTEISERAGVTRGAHAYHFQTRARLVAAAAERLAERTAADLEREIDRLPVGADRHAAALDMVWDQFRRPLFQVILELSVYARTDPELRSCMAPIEQDLVRETGARMRRAFAGNDEDHRFDGTAIVVLATIRGHAVLPLIEPDRNVWDGWSDCRAYLLDLLAADATSGSRPRRQIGQ